MFIGRENELRMLEGLFSGRGAALVICRGRRRIGKSTLIQQFGKRASRYLQFQGLAPREGCTSSDQLSAFSEQLSRQTSLPKMALASWAQAFSLLANQIGQEKTVVFLDEISWMALDAPDFAGFLKIAWDTEFKKKQRLVLVLCGSVSSWIEKNILNNTGFVGRVSLTLTLEELPLHICNEFWGKNSERISSREKMKLLAVTGGVPRYLEEIRPSQSAEENIRRLCFTGEGLLFNEFNQIFHDIFSRRSGTYRDIMESLVAGSRSLSEISGKIGWTRGGHLSEYLRDLQLSGFIAADNVYNPDSAKSTRYSTYRLSDNYSRFYLKYIAPLAGTIAKGLYKKTAIDDIIAWDVIVGLQFENLVLKNLPTLIACMDIEPSVLLAASPYFQRETNRAQACQIDLLIQTRHSLYVCEMKTGGTIGTAVIDEVKAKVARIKHSRSMSVRTVLIYEGTVEDALKRQGYFDLMVSFEELLRMKV